MATFLHFQKYRRLDFLAPHYVSGMSRRMLNIVLFPIDGSVVAILTCHFYLNLIQRNAQLQLKPAFRPTLYFIMVFDAYEWCIVVQRYTKIINSTVSPLATLPYVTNAWCYLVKVTAVYVDNN